LQFANDIYSDYLLQIINQTFRRVIVLELVCRRIVRLPSATVNEWLMFADVAKVVAGFLTIESSGAGTNLKVWGSLVQRKAPGKFFCRIPPLCGSTSTISRFGERL